MFCRWLAVMRRRAVVAFLLAWAAPAQTLQLGGPRPSRRSSQCVSPVPATMRFDDAAAFEAEVRAYVSTLDEQAMHDPAAPSPLAYAELQRNGRVDLVEGCMEHGGYIQVSKRLGVPLRLAKPADLSSDAPPRFSEPLPPTIGLKLSGSKREADMAASVQALDLAGAATAAAPAVGNGGVVYEPTPLQLPKIETAGSVSVPRWELAWLFRYDGAQRAGLVFFVWLSGAAYGRATAELLEPSVASALQAAAQVVAALYLLSGVAGAAAAAQQQLPEPPAAWLVKLALTGPGGVRELLGRMGQRAQPAAEGGEAGGQAEKRSA